jgi:hypothetical protein
MYLTYARVILYPTGWKIFAGLIYVCLLWRSSHFLGYASLDGDFAVGGRDAGGVVCYQGCVEWRAGVWEHGVVVGQLVGTGAAIDVFGAVYWGFEGEGGEWEGVDLMQLYTVFGDAMGGFERGTCLSCTGVDRENIIARILNKM